MLSRVLIRTAVSFSIIASPALAQNDAPQAKPTEKKVAPNHNVGDPNEKICESITPIGSRLATKRFCGTRSEWADRRLQDKQALERAQTGPCVLQTTGATGRPSC